MSIYESDLDFAQHLADNADAISLSRFHALDLKVSQKPDLTPVSDADLAVETQLRSLITEQFPHDSVIGEEFEQTTLGDRTWIIDPIDGTKNFVRGVPVWATLIALREGGLITLGLVSAPALNRRWWATTGHGAWVLELGSDHPRKLQVSSVKNIADASFSFSDQSGWSPDQFESVRAATWRQRAYGDFWSHTLLAEGAIDLSAEPELALYDYAALVPIVTEAGGTVSQFSGGALPVDNHQAHPSLACSNGLLHQEFVNLFKPKT
jgi:histidinol-phosphatase